MPWNGNISGFQIIPYALYVHTSTPAPVIDFISCVCIYLKEQTSQIVKIYHSCAIYVNIIAIGL